MTETEFHNGFIGIMLAAWRRVRFPGAINVQYRLCAELIHAGGAACIEGTILAGDEGFVCEALSHKVFDELEARFGIRDGHLNCNEAEMLSAIGDRGIVKLDDSATEQLWSRVPQ